MKTFYITAAVLLAVAVGLAWTTRRELFRPSKPEAILETVAQEAPEEKDPLIGRPALAEAMSSVASKVPRFGLMGDSPRAYVHQVVAGFNGIRDNLEVSLIDMMSYTTDSKAYEFVVTVYERVSNVTQDVRIRVSPGGAVAVEPVNVPDESSVQPSAGVEAKPAEFISDL
jgi:hypothetical protein